MGPPPPLDRLSAALSLRPNPPPITTLNRYPAKDPSDGRHLMAPLVSCRTAPIALTHGIGRHTLFPAIVEFIGPWRCFYAKFEFSQVDALRFDNNFAMEPSAPMNTSEDIPMRKPVNYRLELIRTESATGYFSVYPEDRPAFEACLAYAPRHPNDEFMRRQLLRFINDWREDEPAARISEAAPTNGFLGALQRSVLFIVLALLAFGVSCTHPARRLVFQPHKIEAVPPFPEYCPHLQRFWLTTDQGAVEGWLLPGEGATPQRPGPAVMIAHGNRELIDDYLPRALAYRRIGFTVMLGEYRGYGRSAGAPSRARIASDHLRFYDHLAAQPGVDPNRIVFHGRSMGAAVLCDLLPYRSATAIILESTFTSIKAMAHGAPDIFLSDNYDTVAALSAYSGPVLIIHGSRDEVVPVQHALALKQHIAQARLILYDFGHSDGPPDWSVYWQDIERFLLDAGILEP